MAELLPAALGWIDEKKRQALNTIKQALAEAQANPIESTVANALRGVGRGALSMGEMAAKPFDPLGLSAGVTDKILPSNGSAVGDIAEAVGPPVKTGLKIAGGFATLIPAATEDLIRMIAAERRGLTPAQVWQETGATRIPGGGVATEIPDINAKLNLPEGQYAGSGRLGDFYDHPELYDKIPHLANLPFEWKLGQSNFGSQNPLTGAISITATSPENLKRILVHEGQHAVQQYADWAHGTSPDAEVGKSIQSIIEGYPGGPPPGLGLMGDEGDIRYYHNAGEAQSRMAEARMNMTPEELAQTHPEQNYDVPTSSLLLKYLSSTLPVIGTP